MSGARKGPSAHPAEDAPQHRAGVHQHGVEPPPEPGGPSGATSGDPWKWSERRLAAVLALGVLAAVVLGAVVALTLARPPLPDGDSVEAGFARDMVVHHAQAVQMSQLVRDRTDDETIRTLASDIAFTQQGQIGQMQGWLGVWGVPLSSGEPAMSWMGMPMDGRMPGMASAEELQRLRDLTGIAAERLFLQLMIPHHQAGVEMAEAVLARTDQPAVVRLAEAIAASQEAEITYLRELLAERTSSTVTEER